MPESLPIRFARFAQRHTVAVFAISAIVTVVLGFFAFRIKVIPDVYAMIPQKKQAAGEEFTVQLEQVEVFVLAAESTTPLELDKLRLLAEVTQEIAALPSIRSSVTPFNLLTFEREGRRVGPRMLGPAGGAPTTPEELASFRERLLTDPIARNMVISEDGTTLCSFFIMDALEDYGALLAAVREKMKRLEPAYVAHLAGSPPLIQAAQRYLKRDVPRLLVGAIIVVLGVFFLGFGSKRSVLLPSLVVGVAVLWTTGIMALVGFSLSLVSLMVPPLVLILGSSYSIHVITQYYRDAKPGLSSRDSVPEAVGRITTTVMLASGTTVFGFLGLLTAEIRQIREFGVAAALGIALSALLALVLLPTVLSLLRPPRLRDIERVEAGRVARLLGMAGGWVIRTRYVALASLVLISVGFGLTAHRIRYATDYMSYFRAREPSVEENRFAIAKLGGYITVNLTLSAPEGKSGYFLDPPVLRRVAALEDKLLASPDVSYISSFVKYLEAYSRALDGTYGIPESRSAVLGFSRLFRGAMSTRAGQDAAGSLTNDDFSRLTLVVRVYDSRRGNLMYEDRLGEFAEEMRAAAADIAGADLRPVVWGSSMSAVAVSRQLAQDQISSSLIAAVLILALTSVALRSFRYGLFALIPTVAGILLSFLVMVVFSIPLDMVTVMFSSVALGVGVDNSIHLIIQYRRRRLLGGSDTEIIQGTLRTAGRPILHTLVSLVAGLLVLTASGFVPIANFGILVSLAMVTTSGSSLTLLPAILATELAWDARRGKSGARRP